MKILHEHRQLERLYYICIIQSGKTVLYEVFMNVTATLGDGLNVPDLPQGLVFNDFIIYSHHNSRNHLQTLKALTENF